MYYIYVLKSSKNNKSYVGSTSKIPSKRLEEHNLSSNKWTSLNKPFKLIYYESYYCKKDAIHRERFLKSGQGSKLIKIIIKYFAI
jgi:putative endonuclease